MSKSGNNSGDNIKVAVRMRPFSEREISRNAQLIISMKDGNTTIANPHNLKEQPKVFKYDYSYWSHDGYKIRDDGYYEKTDKSSPYVDQTKVFEDLGQGMLKNAWAGYNCSLFAYGQTGSGKSYSIMGQENNKGLVPRCCEELFKTVESQRSKDVVFEVKFSMLEIYNEQVHDLLSNLPMRQGGLKVREHKERGFFVENLSIVTVGNYADIRQRIKEGNKLRTIAATKMNETSSRAHTIVTISFTQNFIKSKKTIQSSINLVDLAGSERQKQTESTGDRFKEATNINQSLSTLGNVIHDLVEISTKKVKLTVRFRDSVLTQLLKNALGGNSKTVMIAAVSPDAENYEQTLSTLRYADRVKEIRTKATVNQVDTDKLIQGLIAEKEKLLRELENSRKTGTMGYTDAEMQRMKEEQEREIERYREQMRDMEAAMDKRLQEARREMEEALAREREQQEAEKRVPHLMNLNEDLSLSGKLCHFCKQAKTKFGNGKGKGNPDVVLHGPGIVADHAEITNSKGEVSLVPKSGSVLHNGKELTQPIKLTHGDRIRFGSSNLYLFRHPEEAKKISKNKLREFTYEDAQEEIIRCSGLDLNNEDNLLQDEVMNILPMVQTVTAMASDMNRPVQFSMLLVSPEARGMESGRTEVFIRVQDLQSENEFLWVKDKFLNRYGYMQEMYHDFETNGVVPDVPKEKDPFWEPADLEVVVGVASLPLAFLAHMIRFDDEPLNILDYVANHCGYLKIELVPCNQKGAESDKLSVNDPMDLVGKPISFKIKIRSATNLPERFAKTWCRFRFYENADWTVTDVKDGQNPRYNFEDLIQYKSADYKLIDYLKDKSMAVEIIGQQRASSSNKNRQNRTGMLEELQNKVRTLEEKLEQVQKIINTLPEKDATRAKIQKVISR